MEANEALRKAIEAAAVEREGRTVLRCADAFRIAEAHSVGLGAIGAICNQNNIKIVQCQLGCFK